MSGWGPPPQNGPRPPYGQPGPGFGWGPQFGPQGQAQGQYGPPPGGQQPPPPTGRPYGAQPPQQGPRPGQQYGQPHGQQYGPQYGQPHGQQYGQQYGPPNGPRFGPPLQPGRPPRRGGSGRSALIGLGIGLAVVLIVGVVAGATGLFSRSDHSSAPTVTPISQATAKPSDQGVKPPTTSPTAPRTLPTTQRPTQAPTTHTTTQRPTQRPTQKPTTQKPTTQKPTQKPTTQKPTQQPTQQPKPRPTRNPLTQNSIYLYGKMHGVGCTMSSSGFNTVAAARVFWTHELSCLNAEWKPIMGTVGHPYSTPRMVLFNSSVTSPCGAWSSDVPFYCGSNSTIYMQVAFPAKYWIGQPKYQRDWDHAWQAFQLAHEYGHHVQNMTGILDAYTEARYNAGENSSAGLYLSRRLEVQAHCFSGSFLRSNEDSFFNSATRYQLVDWAFNHALTDDLHGTNKTQGYWMHRGWDNSNLHYCNTWIASPSLVE